jgi:hypothetical protein
MWNIPAGNVYRDILYDFAQKNNYHRLSHVEESILRNWAEKLPCYVMRRRR